MVKYELVASDYLADGTRDYGADLIGYAKHESESGVMPKTARVRIAAVKEFFELYNIEVNPRSLKDVRRLSPKGGRRTDFDYIDRKILSEILHHGDARFKAFTLFCASSGVRIGEALSIKWSDIKIPDRKEYPDKPASVFIRDSKTGNSRTTFITQECEQALAEWKKVYANYIAFATKRSQNLQYADRIKKDSGDRVFPFSRDSAYSMWDRAIRGAGYFNQDSQTRRVTMNIHRLRNFFSVQVASAAGQQFSELILGHSDKYDKAYSEQSPKEKEKNYKKAEPMLTIGAIGPMLEKYVEDLAQLKQSNEELKKRLADMKQVEAILEAAKTRAHASPEYAELKVKIDEWMMEIIERRKEKQ
jgi:integrase